MYARITTYQANPERMDDMVAKINEVKTQIKALEGVVSSYTVWRSDGQGVNTAASIVKPKPEPPQNPVCPQARTAATAMEDAP